MLMNIAAIVAAGALAFAAQAKSPYSDFVDRLSDALSSGMMIKAEGTLSVRDGSYDNRSAVSVVSDGSCYRLESGDVVFSCDSRSNYVVDRAAREVTVSSYDPSAESVTTNPLYVVTGAGKYFTVSSSEYIDGGAFRVRLVPSDSASGISSVVMVLSGGVPRSIETAVEMNGSTVVFSTAFSSFAFVKADPAALSAPDLDRLEGKEGYFVNDLR